MKDKRYFSSNNLDGTVIKVSGMFQKLDEIFETEIQKKRGTDQTIPRKPGPVSDVNMKQQSPINWEV